MPLEAYAAWWQAHPHWEYSRGHGYLLWVPAALLPADDGVKCVQLWTTQSPENDRDMQTIVEAVIRIAARKDAYA